MRSARKPHVRSAFSAAELLNCGQRDCGWVICHCIPPCLRRERNLSVTGRSRRGAVMGSLDSPYTRVSTLETLIRRALTPRTSLDTNQATADFKLGHWGRQKNRPHGQTLDHENRKTPISKPAANAQRPNVQAETTRTRLRRSCGISWDRSVIACAPPSQQLLGPCLMDGWHHGDSAKHSG
jgi:hypothetical protein